MTRLHDRKNEDCGAGQVRQVVGSAQVVGCGQSAGSRGYAQVLSQDDASVQTTKFDRRGTPLDPQENYRTTNVLRATKDGRDTRMAMFEEPGQPRKVSS
jgi:hypothetical protein